MGKQSTSGGDDVTSSAGATGSSGQALYRQYRPKSIDGIVGQEHITATLAHALRSGKLAHAYLFTGPRGTGKTSIARILAHEINGLPYTDDSMHLDIIEIDAASNRRIDEIRELRDKVNVAPSMAQYKVYIIDEVHMLTREAFNALLKTLEEPPAHVVFILATTEVHKLPETIISRTQRFMFKPVGLDKVAAYLRTIADNEGLIIDDEALALVAAYGEGSFRDSISLLDQTRGSEGKVDAGYVRSLIGQPPDEAIAAIRDDLQRHDAAAVVRSLTSLREQGFAAPQVSKRLGQQLRGGILQGTIPHGIFGLLERLLDVPAAHDPESYLELVLLEFALAGQMAPPEARAPAAVAAAQSVTTVHKPVAPATLAAAAKVAPATHTHGPAGPSKVATPAAAKAAVREEQAGAPAKAPAGKQADADISLAPAAAEPKAAVPATATPADPASIKPLDATTWPQVLDALKQSHNSLYGIARMSRPVFLDDKLQLYFKFAFHQKRLNEAKNRDIMLAAIRTTTGRDSIVQFLVEEKSDGPQTMEVYASAEQSAAPPPQPVPAPQAVTDPAMLATINNIFGSAEVLGS